MLNNVMDILSWFALHPIFEIFILFRRQFLISNSSFSFPNFYFFSHDNDICFSKFRMLLRNKFWFLISKFIKFWSFLGCTDWLQMWISQPWKWITFSFDSLIKILSRYSLSWAFFSEFFEFLKLDYSIMVNV